MPRVVIDPGVPDREALDNEIAHLRGLEIKGLRARWQTVFRRRAPLHLPRHLLFRILAYRLQSDCLGDLDPDIRRLLERSRSPIEVGRLAANRNRRRTELRAGTLLVREWDGRLQRVIVLANVFAWNGKPYRSLSEVAFVRHAMERPEIFWLASQTSSEGRP
jgi:Protein of unknown function (DUF2924)